MKLPNKKTIKSISFGVTFVALGMMSACFPDEVTDVNLNNPPDAKFSATVQADGYTVTLKNETKSKVIAYYAIPAIGLDFADLSGESVTVKFTFPGTYSVKMLAAGKNGLDSATVDVTTTEANPDACSPNTAMGFIATCDQKTWTLIPAAGAYKVGEGPNMGNWWSSGAGDVTGRSCEFNDEYTFTFATQVFNYESHGDFYADGYLGTNSFGCEPESNYTTAQKPWGSGTFKFSVKEDAGVNGLGQLKVTGLGAHIGLQKVRNGGENTSEPASSITYDVLEMTEDETGDILVIGVNIGGSGWWTFTLKEKL